MKKKYLLIALGISSIMLSLTACGEKDITNETISEETIIVESTSEVEESTILETESIIEDSESITEDIPEYNESEENTLIIEDETLNTIFTEVKETLGTDYFPNMPVYAADLEMLFGINPEHVEYAYGELPMVSAHVDSLVGVKPMADKKAEVADALNTYVENMKSDVMQYPNNLAAIPAMQVIETDEYIYLVATFGDTSSVSEQGDEAIYEYASSNVQKTIDIIIK